MLDVRFGDHGPRVVLLQVLLNRQGAGLVVDGAFGRHTRQAVIDAGRRLGSGPNEVAGPDFWIALFAEQHLCAVDAFDMGEEHFQTGVSIVRVGIYEHHGCTLGKLAQTREMMGRLAVLWDVPVTVAMGQQYIPRNPAEAMRFQGQTYTAFPGGSQRAWIARVLAGERVSR